MRGASIQDEVRLHEKLGYSAGDFACAMMFMMFSFYGLYFYTDVFGISAAAVGTIFLVARLWDAVNDPIMGIIADRTRSRWGQFRPYLLWMAFPLSLTYALCFYTPDWSDNAKVAYAMVTYIAFGMLFTAVNMPYCSLMSAMTPDSNVRTQLSQFRFLGSYTGSLFIALCVPILIIQLGSGSGSEVDGYFATALCIAALAACLLLVNFATSRERVQPPPNELSSIRGDLGELGKNRASMLLLVCGILYMGAIALHLAIVPYYFIYYVKDTQILFGWELTPAEMIGPFFATSSIALLVGLAAMGPMIRLIGKVPLFIGCAILSALFWAAQYYLAPSSVEALFMLEGAGALIAGPLDALMFAMFADTADLSEWKTGRRLTGLVMGVANFSRKCGWAVGGALGGFLLAWFGYIANQDQTEATLDGIRLTFALVPAGALALSTGVLLFYPLGDKRLKDILGELAERRAQVQA